VLDRCPSTLQASPRATPRYGPGVSNFTTSQLLVKAVPLLSQPAVVLFVWVVLARLDGRHLGLPQSSLSGKSMRVGYRASHVVDRRRSVVIHDVADGDRVAGNPAKPLPKKGSRS
jgi:hypothetical protein